MTHFNGSNKDAFGQCQDPLCTCPRWNRERPSAAVETKVMTGQFSDCFHWVRRRSEKWNPLGIWRPCGTQWVTLVMRCAGKWCGGWGGCSVKFWGSCSMGLFVCQFLGNLINWTKEKLSHWGQWNSFFCPIDQTKFQPKIDRRTDQLNRILRTSKNSCLSHHITCQHTLSPLTTGIHRGTRILNHVTFSLSVLTS